MRPRIIATTVLLGLGLGFGLGLGGCQSESKGGAGTPSEKDKAAPTRTHGGEEGPKAAVDAPQQKNEGGAKTPEEAFETLKKAANAHDYKAFFQILTKESQDKMLIAQLIGAGITLAPIGTKQNPDKQKELRAIFEKHGIADAMKSPVAGNPQTMMQEMGKKLEGVADRPGLFDDMMSFVDKNSLAREDFKVMSLSGLETSGDKAKGTALLKHASGKEKQEAVELHQVGGRWFVNLASWGG